MIDTQKLIREKTEYVKLEDGEHLFWPRLDVDLSLDSLEDPDRYPLVSRPTADRTLAPAEHARERPPRYRPKKRR